MSEPEVVKVRGTAGPFGGIGVICAIVCGAVIIPDGCGLNPDEVARTDRAILIALPLALFVVGWLVSRTSRSALVALLLVPVTILGAIEAACATAMGESGAIAGTFVIAYLSLPLGVAYLSLTLMTFAAHHERADDPPGVQRFFALDRWRRVAAGGIAITVVGSAMVLQNQRAASAPYAAIAGALAIAAAIAFKVLGTLRHRALMDGSSGAANGVAAVGSSRVDLQACKLEYSIVSPK